MPNFNYKHNLASAASASFNSNVNSGAVIISAVVQDNQIHLEVQSKLILIFNNALDLGFQAGDVQGPLIPHNFDALQFNVDSSAASSVALSTENSVALYDLNIQNKGIIQSGGKFLQFFGNQDHQTTLPEMHEAIESGFQGDVNDQAGD